MDIIQFTALCIIGLMVIYGSAALRESARNHAQEIRNHCPAIPCRALLTMVNMDSIGVRPWLRPRVEFAPLFRQVREGARVLQ